LAVSIPLDGDGLSQRGAGTAALAGAGKELSPILL
jgi:hypothetical protein